MTDFLGLSVSIFDLLVMGLLPVVSVVLAVVYTIAIIRAAKDSMERGVTGIMNDLNPKK